MYKFIQSYYYTSFHLHCENIASAGMHFYESKVVHNVQQLHVWSLLFTVDYLTLPVQHGRI